MKLLGIKSMKMSKIKMIKPFLKKKKENSSESEEFNFREKL